MNDTTNVRPLPNNTGLPDNLKSGLENLSNMPIDGSKVQYNQTVSVQNTKPAYAQGTDIHVGPGQENPQPHEAWNVAQQSTGRVKPTSLMDEENIVKAQENKLKQDLALGNNPEIQTIESNIQAEITELDQVDPNNAEAVQNAINDVSAQVSADGEQLDALAKTDAASFSKSVSDPVDDPNQPEGNSGNDINTGDDVSLGEGEL